MGRRDPQTRPSSHGNPSPQASMTQMLQQLAQRHECDGMHGLIARARDLHARNFGVHHVTQRRLDQNGGAFNAIAGKQ